MHGAFRILVVCTMNVCRSPLAAEVLTRRLREANEYTPILIRSAGTLAEPGDTMCEEAAAWAHVDPAIHQAKPLELRDLQDADLVLPLTRAHRAVCARLSPPCRPRMFTLRQAAALATEVVDRLARGEIDEEAPPFPADPGERLRWLVDEMDAARGTLGEALMHADEIQDTHGERSHATTFRQIDEAASAIAAGMTVTVGLPAIQNQGQWAP